MRHNQKVERAILMHEFKQLGFGGVQSFCNVCRSVDNTLNPFRLIELYHNTRTDMELLTRLHDVLETLKHE